MAPLHKRALDIRWLRKPRYRKFVIVGSLIFAINVFLVHLLVNLYKDPSLDEEDPSGRGRNHNEGGSQMDEEDAINSIASLDNQFKKERQRFVEAEKLALSKKLPSKSKPLENAGHAGGGSAAIASLHPDELDFTPDCHINTKEALSAIRRAKTQHCKRQIVNATCALQRRRLYAASLPSYCPAPGMTAGKLLGCFQDDQSLRLLAGYFVNLEQRNSPVNCSNLCLQSGFPYAGVEYWTECFCGNEAPPSSARLPDSSCNMKCPGDSKLSCGGYLTINVHETGIVKFAPQIPVTVPTEESSKARIVYLLTLSGRALRQVKRLIRSLYHRDHYFFIHVDARQDYLFRELIYLESFLPNVKLMRRRHATMWAGASLLQMLLSAMREVLSMPWSWDFIINLSESDFPIKKNEQLVDFLTANKNKNFVKSTGREIQRFIQKQGLDKTFVECDGHMWRVGDRKLPTGIQLDGGSDWMALSREFVEYVTSTDRDDLLKGLDQVYKHTLLPAESYFHTVLRNTKFCNTYIDNNLHLTNWKRHLGCKCQYKHIVDWCGCSPNDFTPDDWPRISATSSNNLYFARKFEPIINQEVVNKLEMWVYDIASTTVNYASYWQSIYHHADLSPSRDDAIMSLSSSLARIAATHIFKLESSQVREVSISELSSYHHDDIFQGILLRYTLRRNSSNDDQVQMESWFKPINSFQVLDKTVESAIQNVIVTGDFDVKELRSRKLDGSLGPLSDVIVVYTLAANHVANLTFLLVDPAGRLAQVAEVHVTGKAQGKQYTGSTHAVVPTPMLPGIWQVRVYSGGFHVANTKFLVVPLEFWGGSSLTDGQAGLLNGGGRDYRISADKSHWTSAVEENTASRALAAANSKRVGPDLQNWTDSLVRQIFRLVDTCHVGTGRRDTEPCVSTVWSTSSPDPKSSIQSYNAATGTIS